MLAYEVDGAGPPVVLVHGFTQTGASWAPLAGRLRRRFQVMTVDLPGHGRSPIVEGGLAEAAAALAATGGPASYVGYSMGGRVCLRLALDFPDQVAALVLLGASPGIEDEAERAARQEADEERAAEVERDGVARFLERWLAQPLFATLPEEAAGVDQRLANRVEGLAAALRQLGPGRQEPMWSRLSELGMPVLLMAGERDVRYIEVATRMVAAIGDNARVTLIPGAGHAAHLERSDSFTTEVEAFLAHGV